ncbi:MAG: PQQ-binding-like beta-propeller repeat protein [Acidobacteriota bacterium]|nr:PQQ-binding-like beta-propeller repeat protein [Acidobacteriota bacterium]
MRSRTIKLVLGASVAVAALFTTAAVPRAQKGRNVNWTTYFSDDTGSRFVPLDQINASNFSDLEVAWRFKTDNLGNRPEYKLEGTPIEVNGVVYATAGNRRDVIALDATTGELLWMHGEHEGARGAAAPRQLSGRGLSYWPGGNGVGPRIVYVTPAYFLVALDAKTGERVRSFGIDGRVDLKKTDDQKILPNLTTGEIGWQSAPTVVGDEVLVGSSFREGFTPTSYRNNRGSARAYDVRTGRKLWEWHTIPSKGQKGYDTWLNGSADYTGNTGVWTEITADPVAGLAYLPVESPTSDFYGGKRPGDNLYSDSLVAVDLKTGKMKWYFQFTHHDIWDYDMSSAPLLMNIVVDGKPIKAVAEPTKMGMLFVFDRITGKPVWPIPEKPVPQDNVPGEWYSPTQPIPSKPAPYARNGFTKDDLIDFTPALHEKALEMVKDYKLGPIYTPPVLSQIPPAGPLATLSIGPAGGGTNWPGGSFNPENHTVYVYACNGCLGAYSLVPPPPGFSDLPYVEGQAGQEVRMINAAGAGQGADAEAAKPPTPRKAPGGGGYRPLAVDGLPLDKPPYGSISAIDLDTGQIVWKIAHGETPDYIRNNPALKGVKVPRTGQRSFNIGTLVTKTLVIAGDPEVTTTPDHPRGAMLRAYDQKTGKEVGNVLMPAGQSGSPMSYMVNGKQYIIVAVSGGNYSGEYICYTLPNKE